MKHLLFIMTVFFFCSCKKDLQPSDSSNQNVLSDLLINQSGSDQRQYQITRITEPYADKLYNTCLNEYIDLNGTVTYYIKESASKNFFEYDIDLKKVTGIGELSGIIFKGGGRYVGKTAQSKDGMDIKARVYYNVQYSSGHDHKMGFLEQAKFVQRDGVIKVDFHNTTPTCE